MPGIPMTINANEYECVYKIFCFFGSHIYIYIVIISGLQGAYTDLYPKWLPDKLKQSKKSKV